VSKRIRLLLGLALVVLIVWWTDWGRVVESFARMNWGWWVAAFVLYLGIQAVSSLRWRLMAQPMGFQGSLGRFVALYFIGMFFNLVLPTSVGGDVVRAWYLARSDGETSRPGRGVAAFSSVFLDRLSGLMMLLALACVAVFFCPPEVESWLPWTVWGLTASAVVGLACLTWLSRMRLPLHRFPKLNARLTKLTGHLREAIGLAVLQPKLLPLTLLLSVIVQVANVVIVWMLAQGLGIEVSLAYFGVVVPVISLLTMLPMSVNGMGVREGAMVLLLGSVGVAGGPAVSLAFLWFLIQAAASLGGVVFYVGGGFARPPAEGLSVEEADHGSVGDHSDQGRERQSQAAA
jgi:glycosyltransferase 2 family protein